MDNNRKHGIDWRKLPSSLIDEKVRGGMCFPKYTERQKWNLTFELKTERDGEKFYIFLEEHGRRNVRKTERFHELVRISDYSEKQQKEMVRQFNQKIDNYETWEFLLDNRPTISTSNVLYRSYGDYLMSAEHDSDRKYFSDRYEASLYHEKTNEHLVIHDDSERYDFCYALASFEVTEGVLHNFYCEEQPVLLARRGKVNAIPHMEADRMALFFPQTDWRICIFCCMEEIKEIEKIFSSDIEISFASPMPTVEDALVQAAVFQVLEKKLVIENEVLKKPVFGGWEEGEQTGSTVLYNAIVLGEKWEQSGYQEGEVWDEMKALSEQLQIVCMEQNRGSFEDQAAYIRCACHWGTEALQKGFLERAENILGDAWKLTVKLEKEMRESGFLSMTKIMTAAGFLNLGRNYGIVNLHLSKFEEAETVSAKTLRWQGSYCALPYTNELLSVQAQLFGNMGISQMVLGKYIAGKCYMDRTSEICEELLMENQNVSGAVFGLRYLSVLQMAVTMWSDEIYEEKKFYAKRGIEVCEKHLFFLDKTLIEPFLELFHHILDNQPKKKFWKRFF